MASSGKFAAGKPTSTDLAGIKTQLQEVIAALDKDPRRRMDWMGVPTVNYMSDYFKESLKQRDAINTEKLEAGNKVQREAFQEVIGRIEFGKSLILDKPSMIHKRSHGSGPFTFDEKTQLAAHRLIPNAPDSWYAPGLGKKAIDEMLAAMDEATSSK